jgi:hypothetical protein
MANEMQTMTETRPAPTLGMTEVEMRQLAEVRTKAQIAMMSPRDPAQAYDAIIAACSNPRLAETAIYSFPRGDAEVKGASIRLVEVIAPLWRNLMSGVTELERRDGESTVKAWAWDLETNTSDEKVFTVSHVRETRKGAYRLKDPRDIYELVANQAARRKRACILALIPQYVVDGALEACEKAMADALAGESLDGVRAKMAVAFAEMDERITPAIIGAKCGKDFALLGTKDIAKLKRLYAAIRDGFVKAGAAFDLEEAPAAELDGETAEKVEQVLGTSEPQNAPLAGEKPAQEIPPAAKGKS